MIFPSQIFKAYDIRGLVEGDLSDELAYRIGRSFAVFLREYGYGLSGDKIVVGRDMRESSPRFQKAVTEGITDEGYDVVDVGLVSTPLFNFSCAHVEDYIGGIMVTASHNPKEYNGFKLTLENGLPVGGSNGMEEIKRLSANEKWPVLDKKGKVETVDMFPVYLQKIFSLVKKDNIKPMKIVVDGGNGAGGAVLPKVLKELSQIQVEYLYIEPDGNFPNHEANPLNVETLKDLQKKVLEVGADFGFAMDGDADRIGLVDEKGNVVGASVVGALVGLEVLKEKKAGKMYFDLRSSQIIPEVWRASGGEPEMCMVGHSSIKKVMKENLGIFASELSQHLYYGDLYDLESSDLSLLYILQMLSRESKKLSELVAPLNKYFHSGEINFKVEDKEGVMRRIEEKYSSNALEVSHLDGLYLKFDWGWFNVRSSNTEPLLRLNLEAKEEVVVKEKVEELKLEIMK